MQQSIFDIEELYKKTFGTNPYKIPGLSNKEPSMEPYYISGNAEKNVYTNLGSLLSTNHLGTEIWLPTVLRNIPDSKDYKFDSKLGRGTMFLPYAVLRITAQSTIIRTPLIEQKGTVKEQFSIDDYRISLRGFFIDPNRVFPIEDLKALKNLFELGTAFYLDNALSNQFLEPTDRVVITGFDLPEVEGGRKHVRPFSIQLESGSVFTLEVNDL